MSKYDPSRSRVTLLVDGREIELPKDSNLNQTSSLLHEWRWFLKYGPGTKLLVKVNEESEPEEFVSLRSVEQWLTEQITAGNFEGETNEH